MTDPLDKFKDVDLEKLMFDDLVRQIREDENERLSRIIMNPEENKDDGRTTRKSN